jgi:hypothetical protein
MSKNATIGVAYLLLFVLLCVPSLVYAQGVTTAAINGKITAANGEVLPGVNVVALHVPSGTVYGVSSRPDGRYNLPNLRVGGPYTVTATLVGYRKQTRSEVYLQLSQNLDMNFTLTEEAVQAAEVIVTGERSPVFNASRTGAATNVQREVIDRLPSLSRNFQDYYKVSPYISGDKGNALGRNSRYNNIQIDGTDFNDLFGLGSTGAPAGQSTVTPISLDAIEEFQLVVSPYDVRQAGFTGAGINAITRSGTNDFRGSAFVYGRDQDYVGKSPDILKTPLAGFTDYQIGGRFGGPIIENTLFFFANAEVTRFKQPFTRTFGNQNLGTNAYTVNPDSLALLTNYLMSRYGYDPGSYSIIGANRESDKLFLRFDYNVSEGQKLTARWNFLRSSEDNSPSRGRSVTDIYFDNGKYKLDNKTHSLALQLTSVFGNKTSNELILGYVDQMDVPTYYGQAFPTLYIATTGTGTAFRGSQNLVLGAEEFRHYNLLGQKYFEITDNFSWYLPSHTLVFGAKIDVLKFRNLFISDGFGAYTYNSIAQFLNNQRAASYTFRYSATSNPLQEANWGANQFGLYVQDEWVVSSRLKLTAGVRVDIPTYPDKPNLNKPIDSVFHYKTSEPPKTSMAWSPRLGFNWAVDEDRNTQVRGGVGIFYGRFPYVWVSNQYSNTGVDFYTVSSAPSSFIADPYGQPKAATTLPTAEVDLTDPNFKAPSIFRWNLGVDHKLPFDLVATVEGIFSINQNDVVYQNINMKGLQDNAGLTPGGRLAGEKREVWGVWNPALRRYEYRTITGGLSAGYLPVDNRFAPGVFLVKNVSKGSNSNVTVQIQRSAPTGLNGTVAYTWGMAKDINSENSTQAASGWRFNPTPGNPNDPPLTYSQWDRRHRIMGALSYRQEWGDGFATFLGVFYNGQSGRPFSYMVFGDINGDGSGASLSNINDLAYIPKDANDIILVNDAGGTLAKTDPAYAQVMGYIDADPYLKENKGKISERSGPREPWAHSVDLRISQEIPHLWGHKIEFTIDILNVLNLLNSDWGWIRNTGVNQTVNMFQFYDIVTTGADIGKPRYKWLGLKTTDGKADPFQPDNILSRWQVQFGARYTF